MERAEIILSTISHGKAKDTDNNENNESSRLAPNTELESPGIGISEVAGIWKKSLEILSTNLDSQIYMAWIRPLKPISFEIVPGDKIGSTSAKLILGASNTFCCNHVHAEYGDSILDAVSEIAGTVVSSLELQVVRPSAEVVKRRQSERASSRKELRSSKRSVSQEQDRKPDASNLNPRYNFSNYVVGGCNQFANAACLRVAENLGKTYNPLFIYGGVGLGKTHLANAIGNASRRRNKKVLLVSSETFVSELITSLRTNSMDRFKSKFRSLDLLIVDDIQFIIGKERTQEEFFHTFNELHNSHSQIIITSDKIPQELTGLEERLKTRFASGLSVDLQAPDFETRVAILKKKAEATDVELSDDVAGLIAERIDTNVRELEGALNRLTAYCSLNNCEPSCRVAREVIDTIAPGRSKEITCDYIQGIVASRFSVSISDITGKRRTQNIASARQVAMYLSRELTGCSYPELGAVFGGRDHSTVIHAVKVVNEKMKKNEKFKEDIVSLRKSL